jgi:flagellar biosynthesis/type III secretory pathway protein FliH
MLTNSCGAMHDAFVPLQIALHPAPASSGESAEAAVLEGRGEPPAAEFASSARSDVDDVLAGARRFRAALADALELSLGRLLRDIACEVIARELAIAPCDVAAIAARALERYMDTGPIRLRVHPDDVRACAALDVEIVADRSLRTGDAVLEVRCGSIDASLEARLEVILS